MEFITDRTQNHVDRLKYLRAKGYNNLAASEITEYNGYAAKGAYNYTDLNRVESAVAELAEELGLTLTTKTDWDLLDEPRKADMERYLSNVEAIQEAIGLQEQLPSSMENLDYEGANQIEYVLSWAYQIVITKTRTMDDP